MIIDGVDFGEFNERTTSASRAGALRAFGDFLERRLGVRLIYDLRKVPFGRVELMEPLQLAEKLRRNGAVTKLGKTQRFPDEPRMHSWYALCGNPTAHKVGGSSVENEGAALYATLAEALERYLWYTQTDYFRRPVHATTDEMRARGGALLPERVAGFSDAQRAGVPERQLRTDTPLLWIQGESLVTGKKTYLPAQLVSGAPLPRTDGVTEPLIRGRTTSGLATWPTQSGARLAGALELIEREAYLAMWLNQLTLPRLPLASLAESDPSLKKIIARCERYRLQPHAILLPTDAPAYTIAVVLEDKSGEAPRFAFGLKAHHSLSVAVQKATTEALRARQGYRAWAATGNTWSGTPVEHIGHRERIQYWGVPEHASRLAFLTQGPEQHVQPGTWENDSEEAHLARVVSWCKEKSFEFISVSLGNSKKNCSPFYIEMVVIPELQPIYLTEETRAFGCSRWSDVASACGYRPRSAPFAAAPHPFS